MALYGMAWYGTRRWDPRVLWVPRAAPRAISMPYHTMPCHYIPVLSYTYIIALLSYYILSSCYIIICFIVYLFYIILILFLNIVWIILGQICHIRFIFLGSFWDDVCIIFASFVDDLGIMFG